MLLFTSNYSSGSGLTRYEFKAEAYEQKADNYIETNKTTVVVDIYMRRNQLYSTSAYNLNGSPWSITIDGDTKNGTSAWDTRNSVDWKYLGSHSKEITHNSDGSKTVTISAYHQSNINIGNSSGSANFTLTKIPRASKISATDADVGSISSIYIDKADNSFTHTITYSLGSKSGTVVTKTQQSPVPFTVPTSLYSEIPGTEGTVTLKCITYSGDTVVGESTTTFKARVNQEDNKPTVSGKLVDSNSNTLALTGGSSTNVILVKNRSTAKITPTATAKNGASIKQITVEGTKVEGSYIEFKNTTKTSFNIVATDSRGFQDSKTLTPNKIIEYIPLTLTAKFYRTAATSSEVKLDYEGNFFNASFGAKKNKLTLKWEYKEKSATKYTTGGTLTPSISNNKYSGSVSLGTTFDYKKSYDFIIYANDGDGANIKLTSLNYAQNITRGEPIFDYGVDKNGNNYVFVNGNLYSKGNINKVNVDSSNNAKFQNVKLQPTVLYDNASGTTGTITLSETSANFSYLEIFYKDTKPLGAGQPHNSIKVSAPNEKVVSLFIFTPDETTGLEMRYSTKAISISGTSITTSNYYAAGWINASEISWWHANEISIVKVIGYR